jgi:virginiamycin B lyase
MWFVEGTARKIGRITLAGVVTEYPISTMGRQPSGIVAGPDGNVWFGELGGGIGRITPAGVITEFSTPVGSNPFAITAGADGNLWYTSNHKIGIVTITGSISEVDAPMQADMPAATRGSDGNVWFLESGISVPQVVRVTPARTFREYIVPTQYSNPQAIAAGPDGNIWFTEVGKVGRLNANGSVTDFATPSNSVAADMTNGPDGNVWYCQGAGLLGRVTPTGTVTEFTLNGWCAGIAVGSDGNLWFTDPSANHIGRFLTP